MLTSPVRAMAAATGWMPPGGPPPRAPFPAPLPPLALASAASAFVAGSLVRPQTYQAPAATRATMTAMTTGSSQRGRRRGPDGSEAGGGSALVRYVFLVTVGAGLLGPGLPPLRRNVSVRGDWLRF